MVESAKMREASRIPLILGHVFQLEVQKGHLKWKVSDVARMAKVSRPLIYYHYGRTKKDILESCLDEIARDFYGLDVKTRGEVFLGHLDQAREFLAANPALTLFYLKARSGQTFLKEKFLAIEARYREKLRQTFPGLSEAEAAVLHAVLHGIVSAPFATSESVSGSLQGIRAFLPRRIG